MVGSSHPPPPSLLSPQAVLSQQHQLSKPRSSLLDAYRDVSENPRSSLSPLTNSLLEQLEARIKDLKVWLRDTELLIFNSCLRDQDAAQQLQSFKVAAALVFKALCGGSPTTCLASPGHEDNQTSNQVQVGPIGIRSSFTSSIH